MDNDTEPTQVNDPGQEDATRASEQIARPADPATETTNVAGLDEIGGPSPEITDAGDDDGDGPDGEAQNPPLPDWGPTDGVHGTDAEGGDSGRG